jgi:hypothetical protein
MEDFIGTLEQMGKWFSNHPENELGDLMRRAEMENPWFTEDSLIYCFESWANTLNKEDISNWMASYNSAVSAKTIGLIPAGNVPLVGLHDLICVLASGHKVRIKFSSKDTVLMKACIDFLISTDSRISQRIEIADRISGIDAIIATGSDNTFRYFENYFGHLPHVFRKNRNSLALITGNESESELNILGKDIFTYFGLGCRNITHILFPAGFNTDKFFEAMLPYSDVLNHNKYANNYTYHHALYLMNQEAFLDNNFLMLKESEELYSPIGVIHYQFYKDMSDAESYIANNAEKIQCVVSNKEGDDYVSFGSSQNPGLSDYADKVDTMEFLSTLD